MHISMFHGSPEDYIQITCHQERYQDRLRAMGFRDTPEQLGSSETENHELNIIGLDSKDAVESYVKKHFSVEIDKRGSLETVKDKALAVINESGRPD